jgi:uncharacterized membrane protein YdbT with pleckstrin-like domain
MSRATATKGDQAAVDKYLLPKEVRVATVRRHPAVLLAPSAWAVGGLLAAAVLSATILRGHTVLVGIVWAGWAVLLARLIWDTINWAVDYFVITSDRILLTSGVFTRSVNMMPLSKVTDMSFHRTFAGRLLGYGDFVVESAGKDQALRTIDHVPYPEQLYLVVCGRIFKDAAAVEEEFEDPETQGDDDYAEAMAQFEAGITEHTDLDPYDAADGGYTLDDSDTDDDEL